MWETIIEAAKELQRERAPITQKQAGELARELLENGFTDQKIEEILRGPKESEGEEQARWTADEVADMMALSGQVLTPDDVERLYQRALRRLEG